MKWAIALSFLVFSSLGQAQQVFVDVKLRPAGSFKIKSTDVQGFAVQKGGRIEARNIKIGLKNLQTGIALRDEHTAKHLEVEKFPVAMLISASGEDGKGEGIIKIRGIEKKVKGTYEIEQGKLNAEFPINISEFGIKGIKYMGIGVQDDALVRITLPLKN